jgi:hypothetical protein
MWTTFWVIDRDGGEDVILIAVGYRREYLADPPHFFEAAPADQS